MSVNGSLILNILLLVGVLSAIGFLMRYKRRLQTADGLSPSIESMGMKPGDDIIAVRKVTLDTQDALLPELSRDRSPQLAPQHDNEGLFCVKIQPAEQEEVSKESRKTSSTTGAASIMMFLLAKENRQLAGYELLQTLLACGLRFGEGHLFHRHQQANGQGPVLCSLAAATASGIFDLQNIGAFSVRGLCLFMQASGNPSIDAERFDVMLETARQLSEGLDTYLLDEKKQTLSKQSLERYCRQLNLHTDYALPEMA